MNLKCMAMFYKARDPEALSEMNMAPLIDVMLVLITILIMTIPIQSHSVNFYQPICGIGSNGKHVVDEIYIDFDGTLFWNGGQASREVVDAKLHLLGAVPAEYQAELHIKPNRLASYQVVAGVLASAQRNNIAHLGIPSSTQYM